MQANLLCRLPSPKSCLGRLGGVRGLVRPGGIVVITSPYTWQAEYTPRQVRRCPDQNDRLLRAPHGTVSRRRQVWLGGYERDGAPVFARDAIVDFLADDFDLVHEADMPLIIREHERKFQYIVSHCTVFRRREE
jgi:hypothetical protein